MRAIAIGIAGILGAGVLSTAAYFMSGPTTVDLGQMVIAVGHMETIGPPADVQGANIIDVKSSNPGVATAAAYRVGEVQIVAVAPGKTDVEFFDSTNRVLYKKLVWVEKTSPGGSSAGYDSTRTQLEQVVMRPRHTQNVSVPGEGAHQISSVTSSNPSVATARTEGRNAIQIYSISLGDTWVNFTDNATNTQYQVHVWVVDKLDFVPPPLPGPNADPGPIAGSKDTTDEEPEGDIPRPGEMDQCLLGSWKVVQLQDLREGWAGGAGAQVRFESDGTQTIDYTTMAPLSKGNDSMTWTGTSVSKIASARGRSTLVSIVSGNLLMTLGAVSNNAQFPFGASMTGPAGLGGLARGNLYVCADGTLEYKTTWARDRHANYRVVLNKVSE